MQELLLMMEDRLYDGAEHREDELATGHVAEHSPRSTDDPDPSTACLGLLVNLLPPSRSLQETLFGGLGHLVQSRLRSYILSNLIILPWRFLSN